MKYDQFINEEFGKKKELFKLVLNKDIHIYVDNIIFELKKNYSMNTWFLYSDVDCFTLGYFENSDDSEGNIKNIRKFLNELPYFKNLSCYDDDHRLVIKFFEVGDPITFKFCH